MPTHGAPMTAFRSGTYAAVVTVLVSQRKGLKLMLRKVAAQTRESLRVTVHAGVGGMIHGDCPSELSLLLSTSV